MKNSKGLDRRRFLSLATLGFTATALAPFSDLAAQPLSEQLLPSNTEFAKVKIFENIKQVKTSLLDIGYAEIGPSNGEVVILLHGWPYDIHSYFDVAPLLAAKGYRVLIPHLRGHGSTRFLSAETKRNAQQSAIAKDVIDFMDALNIKQAILGGFDWGARTANIVAALWPERTIALVSVSGYLIGSQQANKKPLPPAAELSWWYMYYFATERGREGYQNNTHDFAKLVWKTASPKWQFDDSIFDRSTTSLTNPDHVAIVISNYRWRLGLEQDEPQYVELENKLATFPGISVPTITLEGDANGAPHPKPEDYKSKFKGKYKHYTLSGGIGHNIPQEAPNAFADALIEVAAMAKG